MSRRTTVEIDEELLARAKRALGIRTTRGTIEEALRRATADVESEGAERVAKQLRFLEDLGQHVDLDVLASDEMWR